MSILALLTILLCAPYFSLPLISHPSQCEDESTQGPFFLPAIDFHRGPILGVMTIITEPRKLRH